MWLLLDESLESPTHHFWRKRLKMHFSNIIRTTSVNDEPGNWTEMRTTLERENTKPRTIKLAVIWVKEEIDGSKGDWERVFGDECPLTKCDIKTNIIYRLVASHVTQLHQKSPIEPIESVYSESRVKIIRDLRTFSNSRGDQGVNVICQKQWEWFAYL